MGRLSSHNLWMSKYAKFVNHYAANQLLIGVAAQSNKFYLSLSGFLVLAGVAARQINAIR